MDNRSVLHQRLGFGVLFAGLGIVGFLWARTEWRTGTIRANHAAVWKALALVTAAERDFRDKDPDGNKVKDFWTGDLAGLHKHGLIPRELAEADVEPLTRLVPTPIPYHGYYFKALNKDNGVNPPVAYRQETDKTSGKVHHLDKFGFVAWPGEWEVTGTQLYIVNENNTIFPRDQHSWVINQNGPPSRNPVPDFVEPPSDWPTDEELRWYSKYQ